MRGLLTFGAGALLAAILLSHTVGLYLLALLYLILIG